jgi:intein/homing endonuclease
LAILNLANAVNCRIQFLYDSTGKEVLAIKRAIHVTQISVVETLLPEETDSKGIAEGIHTLYQQLCQALNDKGDYTSSSAQRALFIRLLLASRQWKDEVPDEGYLTADDLSNRLLAWNSKISFIDIRNLIYYLDTVLRGEKPDTLSLIEKLENYEAKTESLEILDKIGSLTGIITLASTMWQSLKTETKLLRSLNKARKSADLIWRSTCRHIALKAAQRTLRRRMVFVADQGIMRLCPDRATDKDLVALFNGSSTAYMLRNLDN